MTLAAIDIGSNAIRFQVVRVIRQEDDLSFKKLEYIRFPLRLGKDVFETGRLSDPVLEKFTGLMRAFKLLIDLYEVEGYIAAATSAMRESENGWEVAERVEREIGLKINIIEGEQEAVFLSKAIIPTLEDHRSYVHIDVGGGSTELNIYKNSERIKSKSFRMGSVRQLSEADWEEEFSSMTEWLNAPDFVLESAIMAIGTGGNIRKLFNLSNYQKSGSVTLAELQALQAYISAFTYEQRMKMLKMNPDRADVILPASEIYTRVMKACGADRILVPNVGLKDGLLFQLYEDMMNETYGNVEYVDQF